MFFLLYFIIFILIFCFGFCVVLISTVNGTITNLICLAFIFFLSSLLLLMLNLELLATIYLLIYLGALIVLFLFVVMLINLQVAKLNDRIINYMPLVLFVLILYCSLFIYIFSPFFYFNISFDMYFNFLKFISLDYYMHFLSTSFFFCIFFIFYFLFTQKSLLLILAGMILLLAMIGAIILTISTLSLSDRKSQLIFDQNLKNLKNILYYLN